MTTLSLTLKMRKKSLTPMPNSLGLRLNTGKMKQMVAEMHLGDQKMPSLLSTFMEMVDNIKFNDTEILWTCPTVTDETPDLVTETDLGIPSASNSTGGPSPLEGDHLGTAPQIGMPSHVGPSEVSIEAQILDRDNLEAIDVGLEESELSLTISNHSESSSCSDGGVEQSRLSTGGEADVTSSVTLLAGCGWRE